MKVRIKFSKLGNMRFIGHLDIMRYFQKAMRRAKIPIKYSEGFSPHQIMSFASPLSIGVEGYGEYMDIEIVSHISSKDAIDRLNENMCEGMKVLSFLELDDDAKNSMSIVDSADYKLSLKAEDNLEEYYIKLSSLVKDILSAEVLIVEKESKDKIKEVDIKPLVNSLECRYEDGKVFLFANLCSGSANNLKPELLIKAFYNKGIDEILDLGFKVERYEIYAASHIRLDEYGKEII